MNTFSHKTSGFSLVEISLAIVVIAVGLSVVVVMFPAGLGQNAIAAEETQAAFFAEEVFSTVQALGSSKPWSIFLADVANGIPIASPPATTGTVFMDNNLYTIAFASPDGSITNNVLRYKIEGQDVPAERVYKVSLEIWPGEWGSTDAADALTFYTEVYDSGL